MTSNAEEFETAQATATGDQPKGTKKAHLGKRARHVASSEGKTAKKGHGTKKARKGAKKTADVRDGSKTARLLDLLKRADGATTKELLKATGWKPHPLRGFISGTLSKKMGLTVVSSKGEVGERSYSVKG